MRYIILALLLILSHASLSKELTENLQAAGFTPLHAAAWNGNTEEIESCIVNGLSINVASNSGITPLHSAVLAGKIKAIIYLIENGADLESRDANGRTPLFLAVEANDNPKQIIDTLVSAGADLSVRNKWGKSLGDAAWQPEAKEKLDEYQKNP